MKILKNIRNSPFKYPIKKYYFGVIQYGTPYFYPFNFNSTIFSFRILKLKSKEESQKYVERYPHLAYKNKFSNLPMVRRNKNWIFKVFNNWIYLEVGYPFSIKTNNLGWKDKFNSPRFEWSPAFYIFFFKWQFCIWWCSPDEDDDKYWEMYLWYKYYSEENIIEAEKTWGWIDYETKISTWNKKYLK